MTTDQKHIENLTECADWAKNQGCDELEAELRAAAERIRVLGEECEAWRKRNTITNPREYERALADVVPFIEATDAARGGSR